MNFLIDAQLPPVLARLITALGHNAIHVEEAELLLAAVADSREQNASGVGENRKLLKCRADPMVSTTLPPNHRIPSARRTPHRTVLIASSHSIHNGFAIPYPGHKHCHALAPYVHGFLLEPC